MRRDLTEPQRVVQSCHAVIESLKHSQYEGEHPYVIVFGLKTEKDLEKALDKVRSLGYNPCVFREPDRNNEMTAFATDVMDRTDNFKRFQLLK